MHGEFLGHRAFSLLQPKGRGGTRRREDNRLTRQAYEIKDAPSSYYVERRSRGNVGSILSPGEPVT